MEPRYSEDGDYLKIVFEFRPLKSVSKSDEEILLEYFKMKRAITIHEMIEHLSRSKNTVFKVLHKLIKQNLVKQLGKGRNARYVLRENVNVSDLTC